VATDSALPLGSAGVSPAEIPKDARVETNAGETPALPSGEAEMIGH
jgi:hypothetical protein